MNGRRGLPPVHDLEVSEATKHELSTLADPQAVQVPVDKVAPAHAADAPAGHWLNLAPSWKRREVAHAVRRPLCPASAASQSLLLILYVWTRTEHMFERGTRLILCKAGQ